MKKIVLLLSISLSLIVMDVEAQSFLKKLENTVKKASEVINKVDKAIKEAPSTQNQTSNPDTNSSDSVKPASGSPNNTPQDQLAVEAEVPGIVPKITTQTKFVYVAPYSKTDRVVRDSMIMIESDYKLTYVNLRGEYIYGTNSNIKKGGAGYNNTRGEFSDGAAMVMRDNVKAAIIYTDQKYVDIPATYEKVTGFTDGIAMAEKRSGIKYASCYINNQGKEVLPSLSIVYSYYTDNFEVGVLSEGMRAFIDPEKKLWGYADTDGKIVIKPQFHKVLPFSDGLAAVLVGEQSYNAKWGFVDKQGVMQIPAQYKYYPSSFSEGLAAVRTGNDTDTKMAFIDKTGKIVSPEYYACNNFNGGYAFIKDKFDHTAVVDTKFNVVKVFGEKDWFTIPRDDANNIYGLKFYQSLTAVKLFHGGEMIINSRGDVIYNNPNLQLDNFYDGVHAFATVKIGNNHCDGFINKAGEVVIVFIPQDLRLTTNKDEEKLGSPEPIAYVPLSVPPVITPIVPQPAPPTQGVGRLPRKKSAAPEAEKYALTLEVHPQEAGTAEGGGIHVEGSVVTINTKMTNENKYKFSFIGWEKYNGEKLSSSPRMDYQMPSSVMHLNAVYKTNPRFKLAVIPENSDFVSVKGGGDYYLGEPFTIEAAIRKDGYKFKGWYLDNILYSKSAILTKPMPEKDMRLVACYQEDLFLKWRPTVVLTSNIPGVLLNGAGEYDVDDEFTISANTPQGYQFVGWHGNQRNLISTQNVYKRKIGNQSLHYRAIFKKIDPNAPDVPSGQGGGNKPRSEQVPKVIDPDKSISGTRGGKSNTENTQEAQNAVEKVTDKSWSFAGSFDINLSSQSIAGFPNSLPEFKLPATAYLELHNDYNMPTPYSGDVLGALYFDFDTVTMPAALKQLIYNKIVENVRRKSGVDISGDKPRIEREYKYWSIEMEGVISLFPMPLLIFRKTDTHLYGYGNLIIGANRSMESKSLIPHIMRLEYTELPEGGIVLGKYEIYEHDIVRPEGSPKNRYRWVNQGIDNNQHTLIGYDKGVYSEPDMENRFKGCELYPTEDKMIVPFYPKGNMARILDNMIKDTADNDQRGGESLKGMTFADFVQMVYSAFFEEIYNEQRLYDQPDAITGTPLPAKD